MTFEPLARALARSSGDPRLAAAFRFLRDLPAGIADGVHALEDGAGEAHVRAYTTRPLLEGRYEAHRRCVDVHYLLSGREAVRHAPLARLRGIAAYDEAADIAFYDGGARPEGEIVLRPGDVAVYGPDDGHMPGIAVGAPARVRKVVLKLPLLSPVP